MDSDTQLGYYYPNKFARITLEALEEIIGKHGLNAILNLADQSELIENFPGDNLNREFEFSDYSAIISGIEELYGKRGGRGLALRAGRRMFSDILQSFGALAGVDNLVFKQLPLKTKMRIGLPALSKIYSKLTDQICTVEEQEDDFIFSIHRCPICWGRSGEESPVCFVAVGLIQEGLNWISGGSEFRVNETKCIATGDDVCEFTINKSPLG